MTTRKVSKKVEAPIETNPPVEETALDDTATVDPARLESIKKNREEQSALIVKFGELSSYFGRIKLLFEQLRSVEPGDVNSEEVSDYCTTMLAVEARKFRKIRRAIRVLMVDMRRSYIVKLVAARVESMSEEIDEIESNID